LATLFKADGERVKSVKHTASSAMRVFSAMCARPITSLKDLRVRTGLSFPTATTGVNRLADLGIVREVTGGKRNRIFAYDRYLSILNEGDDKSAEYRGRLELQK